MHISSRACLALQLWRSVVRLEQALSVDSAVCCHLDLEDVAAAGSHMLKKEAKRW